jgi:hypothetical protein
MEKKVNKLLQAVWITDEFSINKIGEVYNIKLNDGDFYFIREFDINELSRVSRELSLMVYEHFNPNHYDIKPAGFTKDPPREDDILTTKW